MKKLIMLMASMLLLVASSSQASKPKQSTVVLPPLGVQLWSVRDALEEDFRGTLAQLADMGIKGVEFFGRFGPYTNDPQGLKTYLDSLGLQATSTHANFVDLAPEVLHKNLLFYKTLGIDLVIIPMDKRAWDPVQIKDLVADLNRLSLELNPYGMKIGYHNHAQEFAEYKGKTFWDYIAKNTVGEVVLQLDVGWVSYAGKSPMDYIKRYPGRTLTNHLKVRTHKGSEDKPFIGESSYGKWPELIEVLSTVGGARWLLLEQEEYPDGLSSMESLKRSKLGLEKQLSEM